MATPPRSAAGEVLQRAEQAPHRGAGAADDDGAGHAAASGDGADRRVAARHSEAHRPRRRIGSAQPGRRRGHTPSTPVHARRRRHDAAMTTRPDAARGPVHRHRPRRHRRPRPRRGDRLLRATPTACARCTRRPTRSRASARRCWPSATRGALHPAARAALARVDDREVPRPQRPRPAAARLPRRRRRGGRRAPCASAGCGCSTTRPERGTAGQPGQLRPPQGRRRRAVELVQPAAARTAETSRTPRSQHRLPHR